MSGANFRDLLNWELRHLVRMRVLWLILFALAAALIWGASTTAALHADQEHARQETVQKQQEWMSMVRQRAQCSMWRRAAAAVSSSNSS